MTSQVKTALLMIVMSALLLFIGAAAGGRAGLFLALAFALVMNIGSYWFSDKIVLSLYKAKELEVYDSPMIHQMVEELAQKAGLPKPKIYLVPQPTPNAFATGRNPEHAALAVTEGLLKILSPQELKGVLAHEMGHIANRDILIQTIVAVMASCITSLAYMLRFGAIFGGRDSQGGGLAPLIMAILAPIAALLIQMGISRSREYGADRTGAELSGSPEALASALAKLSASAQKVPMQAQESTAHMCIVNPLAGGFASLFSTHPPVEDRIARLHAMRK